MIIVVDYQMGNVGSILNMVKKIGAPAKASSDADEILAAEKLILPGVGSFDRGMRNLEQAGLVSLLNTRVLEQKTPILGICLGMQMMTRRSEEGTLPGLGWIQADTVRFRIDRQQTSLRVPHMGWNNVDVPAPTTLFQGLEHDSRFYFVHSYHVVCDRDEDVLARTHHGSNFASSIGREQIFGTQFHPEKSHKFGLRLLRNFVELN